MSQQIPLLRIGRADDGWSAALSAVDTFPLIEASWAEAAQALARVEPAAVIITDSDVATVDLTDFAAAVRAMTPYVPLLMVNPRPEQRAANLIAFNAGQDGLGRIDARINAALRVRTLHGTVLRRLAAAEPAVSLPPTDPLSDTTVLLLGRGASYPNLSIALGERVGVIGALSIEAAAKHLNARDLDGVVIGDGFSQRVVEAFLLVLAEDARFRDLPVVLTGAAAAFGSAAALANLELAIGVHADIAAHAMGLFRQHALNARLVRALRALDSGGLLDARTGLLTQTAFETDFAAAVAEAQQHGSSFSAARFVFDGAHDRLLFDAARILSRLMRRMDFACLQDDGSVLVGFASTDLRTSHMVARRLASVLRHTFHGLGRDRRVDPHVTLVTLLPKDSATAMRERLETGEPQSQAEAS